MTLQLQFKRMDEQKPTVDGIYIVITKNGAICSAKWVYGSWNGQFKDCVYQWCRINKETLMLLLDRNPDGTLKEVSE